MPQCRLENLRHKSQKVVFLLSFSSLVHPFLLLLGQCLCQSGDGVYAKVLQLKQPAIELKAEVMQQMVRECAFPRNPPCQHPRQHPKATHYVSQRSSASPRVSMLYQVLSGPLNRLNAILSLLHPLDRYRKPSAIGSAIGRPYLALSRIKMKVGVLNRLVLNRLECSTAR